MLLLGPGQGFQGMGHRVSGIQRGALTRLVPGILGHQGGLEGHAPVHQFFHQNRIRIGKSTDFFPVQSAVEVGMFDHFGPACSHLPGGQGFQKYRVYKDP